MPSRLRWRRCRCRDERGRTPGGDDRRPPLSPTPRAAWLLGALALSALVVPPSIALLAALVLVAATAADAASVRLPPRLERRAPRVLSRGVPAALTAAPAGAAVGRLRLRQPAPPDVSLVPEEADGRLEARVLASRRGRHLLPPVAVRTEGRLGLARWSHRLGGEQELLTYPDLHAARRLATAVRQGRFADQGRLDRGPLGLGTDFESVRDYVPGDDVRQVNWRATARLGRPMSNQYRVEQDRDVLCVVDCGRLMAAPIGDRTRLDAAVDAAAAIALAADEVGDRCGLVAFDSRLRRRLSPARSGGRALVEALFDVEPSATDSDYELAFRAVGSAKRGFVLVLSDLLEESAARPLLDAMPLLARRHAVAVASSTDTELEALVRSPPARALDAYAAAVALDVLAARSRVSRLLRAAGATVIEAPPDSLGAACTRAYIRAKTRGEV